MHRHSLQQQKKKSPAEKWGNLRRKAVPSLVLKTINLMSMQDPKAVKKSVAEQLVSIIFHGDIDSQPAGALD